ncbi:hypothetical protein [Polynucleobacter sp. P1-05-14]|uniref:hypothetical protein n=1 Tax=Polynucleobacter sp. P1-05-14 TaxID=1819732 RepID=UPI001C0C3061|nr:hypothetical protein [Polynucleobacter sp. P1-05-14]MBU3547977.1 hypothetical protein [Polynucleobacter sp. P1-05-14]
MKIFWSWQSDTAGKIGRHFIRDVLNEVIAEIQSSTDIDEPQSRENVENLHLDHDIKNVVGSPDLANLIFEKIDAASVLVADITLVGNAIDQEKKFINSNVAIELGYALKGLSSRNVLLVMNTYFGTHENLPFDLRHKGGIIEFHLTPEATKDQIKSEFKRLKGVFLKALSNYIVGDISKKVDFLETSSTYIKAAYFDRGEVLGRNGLPGVDEVDYFYPNDSLAYVRIIPAERMSAPITLADLKDLAVNVPVLLKNGFRPFIDINEYGVVGFIPRQSGLETRAGIQASTQLFANGEFWLINNTLIKLEHGSDVPREVRLPFIPHVLFEQTFMMAYKRLCEYFDTQKLDGAYQLEIGVSGCKNVRLAMNQNESWGPIKTNEISVRSFVHSIHSKEAHNTFLSFFDLLIDATGFRRDPNLYGITRQE